MNPRLDPNISEIEWAPADCTTLPKNSSDLVTAQNSPILHVVSPGALVIGCNCIGSVGRSRVRSGESSTILFLW